MLFLITTVSLMAVALYNGFPLVENDSAAYIEQAIYPHFTPERTPFYGMFLGISSLHSSLWFTVLVQCSMLAYLLLKFIFRIQRISLKPEDGDADGFNLGLVAVIAIISFTCVSWVVSYLMPDVFGGILLLATLLFISENKRSSQSIYLLFIFIAMLMHNSHFPILVLFSLILLVAALVKKQPQLRNSSVMLLGVCVMTWGVMCSMNAIKKHGFTFSRGRDIMLTAKLAETGILNLYLDDNCGKKPSRMCDLKASIPGNITEFLTSGEGPVYKMGGWDSSYVTYSTIVHDVFTTPRYVGMFAQKAVVGTLKQVVQIQCADKVSLQGKETEAFVKVKKYFADELPTYSTSLQNTGALSGSASNFVYYLFFALSSLWMLLYYHRVMSRELAFMYGCLLLFLLVNAFVTASLSAITYKFQYRVAWLLPAANSIVMIRHYYNKFQSTNSKFQSVDPNTQSSETQVA